MTSICGLVAGGVLGFLSGFAKGSASSQAGPGLAVAVQVFAALLGAALAVVSSSGIAAICLRLRGAKQERPPGAVAEAFS